MWRLATALRLALFLALAGNFGFGSIALARQANAVETIAAVSQSALPTEARDTLRLIQRGGPFPFPYKDGSVFGNFENRLPSQPRGYYREYTVPTPGRHDRGARRLIAGSGRGNDVTVSGEYYYTEDHYRHFLRIIEP